VFLLVLGFTPVALFSAVQIHTTLTTLYIVAVCSFLDSHRWTNAGFVGFSLMDIIPRKPQLLSAKLVLVGLFESTTTKAARKGNRTLYRRISICPITIHLDYHNRTIPFEPPSFYGRGKRTK
jgi:hypothetical protein